MFFQKSPASKFRRACSSPRILSLPCLSIVVLAAFSVNAQSLIRELEAPETVSLSVKNRHGRVSVIASDEQQKKVTLEASSTGAPVTETDFPTVVRGGSISVEVRDRGERNRIDLVVRIPVRSKVTVEGEAGAIDIVGNLESASVRTNTGTIHADVPLEALKYNFLWSASRPRYLSDVELPEVKEKAGGKFVLSGKLGEEKPLKEQRVELQFETQRGVVLLNVDPGMVPSDL